MDLWMREDSVSDIRPVGSDYSPFRRCCLQLNPHCPGVDE